MVESGISTAERADGRLRVGFLICAELMFNEHAREYRRRGAHSRCVVASKLIGEVIVVPREVGKKLWIGVGGYKNDGDCVWVLCCV